MRAACHDAGMTAAAESDPAVIRISKMAHFAPGFLALALLAFVPGLGTWSLVFLVLPVLVSVAIERLRTVADREAVTARTLLASRTVPWGDLQGLRFSRGRWARACRGDGAEVMLPAVTFATLPALAAASGGRVPNPYNRNDSGERVGSVQEEPRRDTAGDTEQQRQE